MSIFLAVTMAWQHHCGILRKVLGEEPLDADGKGRRMKLIHVLTLEEIDQSPVDEERILGLLSLSGTTNVRDNMLEVKNSRDE